MPSKKRYQSFELTDFNIDGHIILGDKLGLLKIMRSEDGRLILVSDADYGVIDHGQPTQVEKADINAVLGFVLDIGIKREKHLTYGDGFYFGTTLITSQSAKKVSQSDFDEALFEKAASAINSHYQSSDAEKSLGAMRINYLLGTYNDSRLLFPNFYNESYLGLMRILDALSSSARGAYDFAVFAAQVSSDLNEDIYNKVSAIASYQSRLQTAQDLFNDLLQNAQLQAKKNSQRWTCVAPMVAFDQYAQFIFSCFYSAYQYRNKFVHVGIPFPGTVKDAYDLEHDSGMAYLNPAEALTFLKMHRPDGLEVDDYVDMHAVLSDAQEVSDFKDKYFKLIPTWHFLKCVSRAALLSRINNP